MKFNVLRKVVVLQAATALMVTPIIVSGPQVIHAMEAQSETFSSALGNMTLKNVTEDETGNIVWTLSIKKEATTELSHMEFSSTLASGNILKVIDVSNNAQLTVNELDRYVLGNDSNGQEEYLVSITSTFVPELSDYKLEVLPFLVSGEVTTPLITETAQSFSYHKELPVEETTSSSQMEEETTISSEVEEATSSEEITEETTVESSEEEATKETTGEDSNVLTEDDAVNAGETPSRNTRMTNAGIGKGRSNLTNALQIGGLFAEPVFLGGSSETGVYTENSGEKPYDYVQIKGKNNAVGIWSNDKYRLDFSKDFTGKVAINFGLDETKDGVAFVIQNDSRKTQALTTTIDNAGENLGVAGLAYKDTGTHGSNEYLNEAAAAAVQKSFAVGFDLYENSGTGAAYDKNGNEDVPHIAWTLPGNASSYNSERTGLWPFYKRTYILKHHNAFKMDEPETIKSDTWHDFTFSYNKEAKTFTYAITGESGASAGTTISGSDFSAMMTELGVNPNGTGEETKAYWGFTGANGEADGAIKFAFEQVPVDMTGQVSDDVTTQKDDKEVSIVDKSNASEFNSSLPYIEPGKKATFNSTYTVEDADKGVTINKLYSNIGTNNILDLSTISKVKATVDERTYEVTPTVNSETGDVTADFSDKSISLDNGQQIKFSFSGSVKSDVSETTSGLFKTSVGVADNATNSLKTFYGSDAKFWVRVNHPTILSWSDSAIEIDKTDEKDRSDLIAGYTNSFYWQDIDKDDKLKFVIKKGNQIAYTSTEVIASGSESFDKQDFTISSEYFSYGSNKFVIEAYLIGADDEIKQDAELNLTISVTGSLSFVEAPTELKWTGRTSGESKGILSRDADDNMILSVKDSRQTPNWELKVQANLYSSAPFNFIFKDSESSATQSITTDSFTVMNSTTAGPSNNYVFKKEWNNTLGVLLNSPDYLKVGDYSGKINLTWSLYDTATIK